MAERQSYSPPLSAGRHGSPRKPSGLSTPSAPYPHGRAPYVDSATQAELDGVNGAMPSPPSSQRPGFLPLTQRLLKRCYADRVRLEQIQQQQPISPSFESNVIHNASPVVSSPHGAAPLTVTTPSVSGEREDVEMRDVESPTGTESGMSQSRDAPLDVSPSFGRSAGKPQFPPLPSTAAHNARIPGAKPAKSPRFDLHVPLPPNNVTSLPSATSPSSAISPAVSSPSTLDPASQHPVTVVPGSGVTAPSPVKKKLSLGDYLIQRGTLKTPTSEKTQSQATAMLPPTPPTQQPPEKRDSSTATGSAQPENNHPTNTARPTTTDVAMKDVAGSTQASRLPPVT
ncbi:hypothetical protein ARAM_007323 [Aspergillus rambellii]|uniref:Uncharacterized protein n=2 Tax=Aspergillus subgen. Nidulantes TaxID=2720870 RepID=A0A0F8UW66_9EURO|nr:hypothetical protein ARAM_007323 [Aspergillus rambellii]